MRKLLAVLIFIGLLIYLMIECIILYFKKYDIYFELNTKFIIDTISIIVTIMITGWLVISAINIYL